jgi:hypothetical protein
MTLPNQLQRAHIDERNPPIQADLGRGPIGEFAKAILGKVAYRCP